MVGVTGLPIRRTVVTTLLCLVSLVAATLGSAACTGTDGEAEPRPSPTYPMAPHTVRPDERPQSGKTVRDGEFLFTVLGLTDGMRAMFGSHAEFPAKGQFVRIRLVVENTGRNIQRFDTRRQLLITDDGTRHTIDNVVMTIKRQPPEFDVGSGIRVEFDLWYDVPVAVKPTAIYLNGYPPLGDPDPTDGTDVPLK
jgi:hypothetical protein